jgi:methylsterol monooxygenase
MAALALFALQVIVAVASVQIVFFGLAAWAAPLHGMVVGRFGPQAAACLLSSATVLLTQLVGAAMTVPALVGVKFWKIQVKRVATFQQLKGAIPLIMLNCATSMAVSSANMLFAAREEVLLDMTLDLPNPAVLAAQTAFCLLMTEVWFYHCHRLFHENKKLYGMVHKLHHTWTAPVALVSTYAHPIEHVFNNLASILCGPYICGAHPLTTTAYTLVFAIGAYGHHSGYWSDDLGMHDLHHEVFNVNYGNAHILDYLYGTYRIKEGTKASSRAAIRE